MTSEQWDRVERLFEEARARPSGERAAFLQEACDDPVVRREVASLLETSDEAEDLFDRLIPAVREHRRQQKAGWESGTPDDPLDLEDTEVGRYRVEAHLGGGGMGVVYRARDPELDRPVALKFLPPHLAAHPEAEERFVREAKAAAALGHSNIATIHEIGTTEDGRRFIAMAYYEGESLKEKIDREGPLPVAEAVGYAEQIAEALARAHEAGIVHRDVKPANVMVTETGEVKLLDFGLAKAAAETRLTEPGRRLGTTAYMSPQQAEGEKVGPPADLWALGLVLYEMLAGERPFKGERETAVLHAILHETPTPIGTQRPEVPSALERIVERCLQKDPAKRYSSAEALLDDLRAMRSGEVLTPRRTQFAHEGWTEMVSRWWVVVAVAAMLLALTVVAGWALWPDGGALGAQEKAAASGGASPPRSIAVLPFEAQGQEKPGPFTEGIHDDLLTRLSKISALQVISRTSVERYRDTDLSLPAIADSLGVRWIMEGSVLESGGQIRVNAQLIDSKTDTHVWAEDYRRALTTENLFAIQGEITREIANALQATLTAREQKRVGRRPTENLEAYRLYVQGRLNLDRRTEREIRRGLKHFRRAIQRDSTYALAWVGLADALTLLSDYGYATQDSVLPRARRAVERALRLNPRSAAAHTSLALLHSEHGRGPAAIRELRRAAELRPSYAEAHNWRSWISYLLGRPQEGLESARRAVELNPLSPEAASNVALGLLAIGDLKKALAAARRTQKIQADYPTARLLEATALHHLGRLDEARQVLRGLEVPWARSAPRALRALVDVASGDSASARTILRELRAEAENRFYPGLVHAALGDRDSTLEAFHRLDNWGRSPLLAWPNLSLRYLYPDALGPARDKEEYEALIRAIDQSWGLNPDGSLPEEVGRTDASTR